MQAFVTTKNDGSLSRKVIVGGLGIFVFGTTIYFYALEQVPITGRRQLRWLPQLWLRAIDEVEREEIEGVIREKEGKFFTQDEYPGLQTLKTVLERLHEASGLDNTVCDIRVINEPSTFLLKAVLDFITRLGIYYSNDKSHS